MYAYPSALGKRGWYSSRLAPPYNLPAPSVSAAFALIEIAPEPCNEKVSASQYQERPPPDRQTLPHSSFLPPINTFENFNPVSSDTMTPKLPTPDDGVSGEARREGSLKPRPTRASSTASHLTPQLVLTEAEHQSDGDELLTVSEEEEDINVEMETVKSAPERLAEKRKMKRFRLTHAQTRYLTSEFSREPHPDAAQRERLSRDIPGLNPRQVQVWFQNRRAKLKRLTTDDQERIRSSRALPEDFDFSQTLQPTYNQFRPLYRSISTDPLVLGSGMGQRPGLRLGMSHLSPASNSMSSVFTDHDPSPVSATGSACPSPVSPVHRGSDHSGPCFSATQSPLFTSPQFTNPFGHSHSLSPGSPAFQRHGWPSSHNIMMGLGGQPFTITSPSNPSIANTACNCTNLPPLHFGRPPMPTGDHQRFGRAQTTEAPSHESAIGINPQYISPLSSPSTLSYNQAPSLYPSGSGPRAASYCQSLNTNSWQKGQLSPQGYQYGQQLEPHQSTEQRRGSQSSRTPLSQGSRVNSRDQGLYSHSGENYCGASSSTDSQSQSTFLGAEAATSGDTQLLPDASRPKARSYTFPAFYNTQH